MNTDSLPDKDYFKPVKDMDELLDRMKFTYEHVLVGQGNTEIRQEVLFWVREFRRLKNS